MQHDNAGSRKPNLYIYVAVLLGLIAILLALLPRFVSPRLVRRQTALQLVRQADATPTLGRPRPTATPTETVGPPAGAGCRRYSVQAGDTLASLARRFRTTEAAIALANNLYVDLLTVGQVLVVCGPGTDTQPPASPPDVTTPDRLAQPVDVVMSLTYPAAIHNRKPQWISLSIAISQTIGASGAGLLPDVAEATTLEPVILPAPRQPRLPRDQTAALVEHWLSAKLTGSDITLRSQPRQDNRALSEMLSSTEPTAWQWLFVPPAAGAYLFGLDIFSSGEFELQDGAGNMIGTVRTAPRPVWSHEFTVTVDEILGIPRRWWVIASGLGTLVNLVLGLVQLANATESETRD